MTPAIKLLKQQKINFNILSFKHDETNQSYGLEVVERLKLKSEQVYKTIVLETHNGQLIVAITPVAQKVNLKKLALLSGNKKVVMADAHKVHISTGYVLGGVSPIGQKKQLSTYLHQSALQFEHIYVSAGKRGLEVSLHPNDLIKLTRAQLGEF